MKLIRRGEHLAADVKKPQGSFSGDADQRTIHTRADPASVRVSFVRFQPGASTHWHSHSGGQVLHVVEGEGRIQERDGPVLDLLVGDTVTTEPDRYHWHGATAKSPMAHLAVTIGEVTWAEAPERDP